MYDSLPKNERAFDIDLVGETTGESYKGQFVAKCVLTISERHAFALEKTRLMADFANPAPDLAFIATALATLRLKLVKSPDWWTNLSNGNNILDENLVITIYDKCIEVENSWRQEVKKVAEEKKAASGNS